MSQSGIPSSMLPLLLEIGSEEIPARFVPGAIAALEERFVAAMAEARLVVEGVRVLATPRRLVLLVEGITGRQPDRDLTIKGPPVSVAFDDQGQPTPAAVGFSRKVGVALENCERGEDQRGEFLLVRKQEAGRAAKDVLAEILPALVLGLTFRKVMRWGDHDLEYTRPLQWVVALLGDEVIPLEVGYLAAGRLSRGHRTLFVDGEVSIAEPNTYLNAMAEAGVIVDPAQRREIILTGFEKLLAAYGGNAELVMDEGLLHEVVFLCEHPTSFLGAYGEDFFALPAEVITTALKAHQRYFTVRDRETGALLPRFAAVRDGGPRHLDNVIAGNERVLRARLADALFYWNFDQKKSPDERTALLATVTWVEGLGTVLDKSRRLVDLSSWLWTNQLEQSSEAPADLTRAAFLCKSDLTSEMIKDGKEFTKLEGFIGARYAELAGESAGVAQAIEFHYAPRSAAGELPPDPVSGCLSLADRLDTLCGCWLAGFLPTGAKDPYALRRHVLAMVRIILDRRWHLDFNLVLQKTLANLKDFQPDQDTARVLKNLREFIQTRLEGYFTDNLGYPLEVVRAVLPVRWQDPVDALAWVEALSVHRKREDFLQAASGFKRCRNILKGDLLTVAELDSCIERWRDGGSGSQGQDFKALVDPAEKELLGQVVQAAKRVLAAEAGDDYPEVFATLSGLGPAIDQFFTEVRVNVDDEHLRDVRLSFLREIHGLFARYGDFQEMVATDN